MVSDTLFALGESTRLRIVECLGGGALSVTELCRRLTLDQPLVSKHLRLLRESGIVVAEYRQRNRIYSLAPGPLKELSQWTEGFRRIWDARYRAVDGILEELKEQAEGGTNDGSDDS